MIKIFRGLWPPHHQHRHGTLCFLRDSKGAQFEQQCSFATQIRAAIYWRRAPLSDSFIAGKHARARRDITLCWDTSSMCGQNLLLMITCYEKVAQYVRRLPVCISVTVYNRMLLDAMAWRSHEFGVTHRNDF